MNLSETPRTPSRMDRRDAIKWMMAAASTALLDPQLFGASAAEVAKSGAKPGVGYGTDPDLLKGYKPGDLWPLTFNDEQRNMAATLCDVILPADEKGPGARAVNVHEFIDEWISAPYPGHAEDRATVVKGLSWLEAESKKRFNAPFAKLSAPQQAAICDDICHLPDAKPEFREAAQFFRKFRDLAAGGYYSTPEGMKDIGYVGNVALEKFEGPPPEVLRRLGLA